MCTVLYRDCSPKNANQQALKNALPLGNELNDLAALRYASASEIAVRVRQILNYPQKAICCFSFF